MEKIVIIGGGIVGASTAYWLSKEADKDITVIERDPTYKTASFALSMGGFRHQFLQKENVELGLFSEKFIKNISDKVSMRTNGYLLLFNEEQKAEQLEALATQKECGAETQSVSGDEVSKHFDYVSGEGIALASFTKNNTEGFIDPYSLVQWFKAEGKKNGVKYVHDTIKSVKDITADKIVVATGAWISELLGGLPIKPVKHTVFKVSCPKFRADMPLIGDFNSGIYLRPEGNEYLVGSPKFVYDKDYDFEAEWNDFEEIIWPGLYERIPEMAELRMTGGYAGQYDMNTTDGHAIVDKHPDYDNVYFAGGFSGRGLMQGIGVGRALTELMQTGSFNTIDLKPMALDRNTRKEPYVL